MPPVFNIYCDGCGICASICPTDVFSRSKDKEVPLVLYPDECWHCDSCVLDCPGDVEGRKGVELRIPLNMQLLWIDPEAEHNYFDMVGDRFGSKSDTLSNMPKE
ncbi:MAG: ferredoxin family protein [Rhodospirillaceae bacterium]|nr:ferredoxin family protein [Rhodospirillaceae bacterium]